MHEGLKPQEKPRRLGRFIAISGLMVTVLVGCNLEATKKPTVVPPAPPTTRPEIPRTEVPALEIFDDRPELTGHQPLELPSGEYSRLAFTISQKDLNRLRNGDTLEVRVNGFRFVIDHSQMSMFAYDPVHRTGPFIYAFRTDAGVSGRFEFNFEPDHTARNWDISLVINGRDESVFPQDAQYTAAPSDAASLEFKGPGSLRLTGLTVSH